ncbi:glycoside hydrolase family 3 protein [Naumannella sp. ID2617S]|nr:glycoside hydrolase family 3 protein [Naumannella sp. ID2617S]
MPRPGTSLLLLVLAVTSCGTPPSSGPAAGGPASTTTAAPATSSTAPPGQPPSQSPTVAACTDLARSLTQPEQVGQLFMVGKGANAPVDEEFRTILRETHTGSVLLLENTSAGQAGVKRLTDQVRSAAAAPKGVRPLLAADQEGGQVQRLKGAGFDTIPSATEQAKLPNDELERRARGWAEQLRAAGIEVDLAPVTDTVPSEVGTANQPIGALRRGYGSDPKVIEEKSSAFARGMTSAGVSTSVKHFPNLGRVRGNTDLQAGVTDTQTTRTDAALGPFRSGIAAGADLVMVSTAIYSKLDPGRQATFSKVIVTEMIRGDLGFTGVVISDDLGAAKQVAQVSPGDRAVRFVEAGGDLVINGDPAIQRQMVTAVRQRAERDPAFAQRVTESAGRVVSWKARHGAAPCTPTR